MTTVPGRGFGVVHVVTAKANNPEAPARHHRPGARHLFVLALAAYPILHMQAVNLGQIPAPILFGALGASMAGAALLTLLLRPVIRSWDLAAVAAGFVIALFYLYGPVHTAIETHLLRLAEQGGEAAERVTHALHTRLSWLWAILAVGGTLAIRLLWKAPSRRALHTLNVVAAVLVALTLSRLAWAALAGQGTPSAASATTIGGRAGSATSVLGYNPDIYYIVLDGYARADVLRERYGFDNGAFLSGLEELGFRVSTASHANYYWTFLSLSSTLNMDYLQSLFGAALAPDSSDRTLLYTAIRDNAVSRILRERGYRYVHFQSTWGATLYNPFADEQVRCPGSLFQQEFYRVLAEASWLKALQPRATLDLARCHLANLDALSHSAARRGPKFVFAHFVPPHHPYLFARDGRILRNVDLTNQFEFHRSLWERRNLYVDQLQFMNGRVLAAVREILRQSPRPPIIVIQSDHGPDLSLGVTDSERVRIRLANFAAYLLPGAPSSFMPVDGSSVNQFRRLLGHYFGADLPVLPERYYRSTFRAPYRFEAVHQMIAAPGAKRDALPASGAEMMSNTAVVDTARAADGHGKAR